MVWLYVLTYQVWSFYQQDWYTLIASFFLTLFGSEKLWRGLLCLVDISLVTDTRIEKNNGRFPILPTGTVDFI